MGSVVVVSDRRRQPGLLGLVRIMVGVAVETARLPFRIANALEHLTQAVPALEQLAMATDSINELGQTRATLEEIAAMRGLLEDLASTRLSLAQLAGTTVALHQLAETRPAIEQLARAGSVLEESVDLLAGTIAPIHTAMRLGKIVDRLPSRPRKQAAESASEKPVLLRPEAVHGEPSPVLALSKATVSRKVRSA